MVIGAILQCNGCQGYLSQVQKVRAHPALANWAVNIHRKKQGRKDKIMHNMWIQIATATHESTKKSKLILPYLSNAGRWTWRSISRLSNSIWPILSLWLWESAFAAIERMASSVRAPGTFKKIRPFWRAAEHTWENRFDKIAPKMRYKQKCKDI